MARPSPKQKKWNKDVEKAVDKWLDPMIDWVEKNIEKHKESSWFDKYTGERARHFLEMARLEIYNDMYYVSSKERTKDLEGLQIIE